MPRLSLKSKIIFLLISVSFLLITILGSIIFWYLDRELTNKRVQEITSLSTEQAGQSNQLIKNNQLFVQTIGMDPRLSNYFQNPSQEKSEEILKIFSNYSEINTKYLAIYLLDKNGVGVISTDHRFVGQDYSFRNYFKKALAGGSVVDIAIGKTSNQFGCYFSYPISDQSGSIVGVLVLKTDNQEIDQAVLNSDLAKNSTVMLTDQYGIVIASNDSSRFLSSLGALSESSVRNIKESDKLLGREVKPLQYGNVQAIIDNYQGPQTASFYDQVDQENEKVYVTKIGNLPFFLVSEIRLESVHHFAWLILGQITFVSIIGLAFFTFLITRLILSLVKPLSRFKKISESVIAGDFSQRIDIKQDDEFGDLAKVFNHMLDNLRDLYKNLDKKVRERTAVIESKSEEAEKQRSAMVNILEDVEKDKDHLELVTQDLEKFKLAVENASDQVIITDTEGIVVYGNKAVVKITGYSPEEVIGQKAGVLWKTPMPQDYYENMWRTIKFEKKPFIGEIKNKRKSGELYDANISIAPVLNDRGDIIYFVAIEHDITKEKEVDKAKTEFVSLASHQLRTPLSAINWYTEMLLAGDAGPMNEEQKKYLNEVAIGNQRMVDLVDSLLNVSRLDLGTFIVEPEPLDAAEVSKSVIEELSPLIISKKIKVEQLYNKKLKDFNADKKLFRIIFQNLLSNAIKYTLPEGRVKVRISTALRDKSFGSLKMAFDSLVIEVADSGIGIPENQQEKIFSKMFRADNARESETEGTGLGLYIIKSIVDHSGGSIWFKSKEGVGTTFYVAFPLSGMPKKDGSRELD
ncbi:MAG: ATP-binding protein [Candidatus Falkowbacteria bacterium]|nr:ATP-binding protein [Candidatus Falkowbacteria bacterium]